MHQDVSGSVLFYFLPALVVGLASSGVYWAVSLLGVPYLGALFYVTTQALITGAVHIDGFAHVCDAFLVKVPTWQRLEILQRRRLGTLGIVGIAFDIGCKVLLIGTLPATLLSFSALSVLPVCSKIALLACVAFGRSGPAIFDPFLNALRSGACVVGAAFCAVLVLALMGPIRGALCVVTAVAAGLSTRNAAEKEIGGLTAGVLGTANEFGEIAALVLYVSVRTLA